MTAREELAQSIATKQTVTVEELARELFIADNFNQPREQSIIDWQWLNEKGRYAGRVEHYKTMAAAALAIVTPGPQP